MEQKPLQSLSFEELSILNERKEALKKEHEAYVDAHPEIKTLLSSFMSALLLEKPSDVLAFAKDHFATYKPANADVSSASALDMRPTTVDSPLSLCCRSSSRW